MNRWLTLLAFAALAPLAGCGGKTVPVSGVATLDGKAVGGATVVFTSEDGKTTYNGTTDDSGNFTLSSGETTGAAPGNYKVMVTKYPKVTVGADPNSKESLDAMKKMADKSKQGSGPKMGMPGMPMSGGAGGSGAKSELPEIYASNATTTLTAKVPSDGPIKLEMKSMP